MSVRFIGPLLILNKEILPLQINALKACEMLQEEDCDINDIASIIGSDPGMAYKLFTLANSVMYGGQV